MFFMFSAIFHLMKIGDFCMPDTILQLGKRIRNERQQRQWTLEQVIRLTIMHFDFGAIHGINGGLSDLASPPLESFICPYVKE